MRIGFVDNGKSNPRLGSYRIWIKDLFELGGRLGFPVEKGNLPDTEILIFPKDQADTALSHKKKYPDLIIGVVNPRPGPTSLDFCICGSIEERDSLLPFFSKALIFPLVESMFSSWKSHKSGSPLCIGYHGNSIHLNSLQPTIASALKRFSEDEPIRLLIITDQRWEYQWITQKVDGIETEVVLWDHKTVESYLLEIDIGIVPSCYTEITACTPHWGQKLSKHLIDFEDDLILRFKQKTNAGRCFVFHQLGIPVIADFAPAHFHILGDPRCGVLAHSDAGWLHGLQRLTDARERSIVASNAFQRFSQLYNREDHARDLFNELLNFCS